MNTFSEWPLIVKVWEWLKRGAAVAGRIAALEARVSELEETLAKQPGDMCQFCGERASRLIKATQVWGAFDNQFRIEDWVCEKCGKTDQRSKKF